MLRHLLKASCISIVRGGGLANYCRPIQRENSTIAARCSAGISSLFDKLTIGDNKCQQIYRPITTFNSTSSIIVPHRQFHAAGSKVHYLDFRYRYNTSNMRTHLLIIRRQKMKKHKRQKFRKRFKCLLAKQRLKREIAKEKAFRVELLTIIRRAEQFDAREYALKKISEINNKPRELTREEKLENLKELMRINRYQTDYIKPRHKRIDEFGQVQEV